MNLSTLIHGYGEVRPVFVPINRDYDEVKPAYAQKCYGEAEPCTVWYRTESHAVWYGARRNRGESR